MKIKMLTLAAGPSGVFQAGAVLELPDMVALQLIAGGYAVALPVDCGELATAKAAPEQAVLRRKRQ